MNSSSNEEIRFRNRTVRIEQYEEVHIRKESPLKEFLVKANPWVYVVVQDPGGNEQLLGQHDGEENISFIPTFFEKEQALQCLEHLPKDKTGKYEVQAMKYEDLAGHSAGKGFMIYVLNGAGEVLEKIDP